MRIIGGTLGGRRLKAPRGDLTRPTSDRVRESVFNILGPPPADARILDLYAGSGAMGIEALSRGAGHAWFVDHAAAPLGVVRANLDACGLGERATLHKSEAKRALERFVLESLRFTWIFIDPPYASREAESTLDVIGAAADALLADQAIVVVEHDRRTELSPGIIGLSCDDRRRYGDTMVSFYRREPR